MASLPRQGFLAHGWKVSPLRSEPWLQRELFWLGSGDGKLGPPLLDESGSPHLGVLSAHPRFLAEVSVCCHDKQKGGVAKPRAAEQCFGAQETDSDVTILPLLWGGRRGIACATRAQPAFILHV